MVRDLNISWVDNGIEISLNSPENQPFRIIIFHHLSHLTF